jgi:hypothetical protein
LQALFLFFKLVTEHHRKSRKSLFFD